MIPATFAVYCTLMDKNAIKRKKDPEVPEDLFWKQTFAEMIRK